MTLPGSFPPAAVVEDVLGRVYGLVGPFRLRPLSDGIAPPVLAEDGGGRHVLRSQAIVRPEALAVLTAQGEVLLTASRADAPIARWLAAPGGAPVHVERVGERSFALSLFEYVEGRTPGIDAPTFEGLGAQLAQLHRALPDADPSAARLPRLDRTTLLERPGQAIRAQLRRNEAVLDRALELLRPALDRFEDELAPAICHGDAHHHNCHTAPTGEHVFFDFEHLALGWHAYDVATLLWGTLGASGGPAVWSAVLRGYSEVRQLSDLEATAVPPLMACRHLWWLGMHAEHWGRWQRGWMTADFFDESLDLVRRLLADACGWEW